MRVHLYGNEILMHEEKLPQLRYCVVLKFRQKNSYEPKKTIHDIVQL